MYKKYFNNKKKFQLAATYNNKNGAVGVGPTEYRWHVAAEEL